jgi:hypothetical protein
MSYDCRNCGASAQGDRCSYCRSFRVGETPKHPPTERQPNDASFENWHFQLACRAPGINSVICLH